MRTLHSRAARRNGRRWFGAGLLCALALAAAATGTAAGHGGGGPTSGYDEPFRPQFHFTPAQNWMNDPNGLIFYKGEYHLFFQHNPSGATWGNMSWGHAVSRDLVTWEELPVAIPDAENEYIFSGTAVLDRHNTTGFGTKRNPPMVAVYTSATKVCCNQSQALAYSLDRGRTWTKYEGNPVLDIGSGEFRDPKVFWHEPTKRWIMVVARGQERYLQFYGSPDLKQWTHLSDFGPANADGGAWEVPDLFELPVEGKGRQKRSKWVLLVSVQNGSYAGGVGVQYFVGDFDGTTFTAENVVRRGEQPPAPADEVFAGFDGADYEGWTATGDAFGDGPSAGALPGQSPVLDYRGVGLANSFHGGDAARGTLTSPTFTVSRDYINLLVGGGPHAQVEGLSDSEDAPDHGGVFADFEDGTWGPGWTATGTFADKAPAGGSLPGQQLVSGFLGGGLVNTFFDFDQGTGTITSPEFEITQDYVNLLVGGGPHTDTNVALVVDGEPVRTASGRESEQLNWAAWNVADLEGRRARIVITDENTGGWGHILVDHIMFSDQPVPARSTATAVNLLVDGKVVRTASGEESERLDWVGWHVQDLIGKEAQIQVVDRQTGGWGHILVDEITFADAPARPYKASADWLDYGKDFYAAITFEDEPHRDRIAMAWMNSWQYAQVIPTSPWRSAMTLPRKLELRQVDGRMKLVQEPVERIRKLRSRHAYRLRGEYVRGTERLAGARGDALEIDAELWLGSAREDVGLKVRSGPGEETVVGYDVETQELYVDRRRSGITGFDTDFPVVQRAPLAADHGKLHLRVFVDRSSVEVFSDDGAVSLTSQIFPREDSDAISVFADGGVAKVESLDVWRLRSIWR